MVVSFLGQLGCVGTRLKGLMVWIHSHDLRLKVDQRMKVDDSGELPCGLHDLHSRLSRLGS